MKDPIWDSHSLSLPTFSTFHPGRDALWASLTFPINLGNVDSTIGTTPHSRRLKGFIYFIITLTLAALTTGCRCTAISNHQWAGHYPPGMKTPEDIAAHLRTEVNKPVRPSGQRAGFFMAPFKRAGIFGWSDLGYDGAVVGLVKQAALSTDKFYTVDMLVKELQIDGKPMSLPGERYLRAEICTCQVTLTETNRPMVGDTVWIHGRMVWDGDGFIEIHPRQTDDVKKH